MAVYPEFLSNLEEARVAKEKFAGDDTELGRAFTAVLQRFQQETLEDEYGLVPTDEDVLVNHIGKVTSMMSGFNDMHPTGGNKTSRDLERVAVQYLRELTGDTPVALKDLHIDL